MCIVLLEQDPFVRRDMAQAIQSSFGDRLLVCADTVSGDGVDHVPSAVLIDHFSGAEADARRIQAWETHGTVFVWTGTSSHGVPEGWFTLSRPFTEAMLVEILRKALDQEPAGA